MESLKKKSISGREGVGRFRKLAMSIFGENKSNHFLGIFSDEKLERDQVEV